ncbi:unnamed protein product [Phaedon cochleariae]|uniref:Cyclin N-terminal domain-containing protein n=1 Tax=Phaedon cochleariae TaxID=80249 RepID=A0A9P0DZ29_PHACE|nr:unnamed protein product [Phaedon cochleariae]
MSFNQFESELLSEWLIEMQDNETSYVEPVLDERCTILMKEICNMLKQDVHVFIYAVNILQEYIIRKAKKAEEIQDSALSTVVAIFISSKYIGDQDLKITGIEAILKKITGQQYSSKKIRQSEVEFLNELGNNLPIQNDVDDLNTFIVQFERECKIKASITLLCLDVLEMLYLTKKQWFNELKNMYTMSDEGFQIFKKVMTCRFYLPIGILVYVFKNTSYNHSFDVDTICSDLANRSQIHVDHISALVSTIGSVFQEIMLSV